jgi:hypothetical protein
LTNQQKFLRIFNAPLTFRSIASQNKTLNPMVGGFASMQAPGPASKTGRTGATLKNLAHVSLLKTTLAPVLFS